MRKGSFFSGRWGILFVFLLQKSLNVGVKQPECCGCMFVQHARVNVLVVVVDVSMFRMVDDAMFQKILIT